MFVETNRHVIADLLGTLHAGDITACDGLLAWLNCSENPKGWLWVRAAQYSTSCRCPTSFRILLTRYLSRHQISSVSVASYTYDISLEFCNEFVKDGVEGWKTSGTSRKIIGSADLLSQDIKETARGFRKQAILTERIQRQLVGTFAEFKRAVIRDRAQAERKAAVTQRRKEGGRTHGGQPMRI